MAIKKQITFEGRTYNVEEETRLAAQLAIETGGSFKRDTVVPITNPVLGSDDAVSITKADHAGRVLWVPNVSGDRTYTLPTPEPGLHFHLAGAGALAADGHGLNIRAVDNTHFFEGGLVHHDTNQASQTSAVVWGNGTNHDNIFIDVIEAFDIHLVGKSTTVWYVWGWTASVTPTVISNA